MKNKTIYEEAFFILKLDHHLYHRHPEFLRSLKMEDKYESIELAKGMFEYINKNKNSYSNDNLGWIYLALHANEKNRIMTRGKAKLNSDILYSKEITILKFKNDMPFSDLPKISINIFKKNSFNKSIREYKDNNLLHKDKPFIIQINSKKWILLYGNLKSPNNNLARKIIKEKDIWKYIKDLTVYINVWNVDEHTERKIRYSMVTQGCYSKNMLMGSQTNNIYFKNRIIESAFNNLMLIMRESFSLDMTNSTWNKILNNIKKEGIKRDVKIYSERLDKAFLKINDVESKFILYKKMEEIINKKY